MQNNRMLKKEYIFFVAILLALLMLTGDRMGHSLGDYMLKSIGIPTWTGANESGTHLTVIFSFLFLIVGITGAVYFVRPKYPKVKSRIVIGCIAFLMVSPFAAEKAIFLFKYHETGIHSIEYDQRRSKCTFQSENTKVRANCSFTLYNYGKQSNFTVKPLLLNRNVEVEFAPKTISVPTHTKLSIGTEFEGTQHNAAALSGTWQEIGLQIEADGKTKRYEPRF